MSPRLRAWLAASLPPAVLAAFVARFAVDAPFIDECRFLPIIEKSLRGPLPLADLWAQQNEHRAFFSGLLMLVLAKLSRWDIRWEMAANVVLAAGIFAICAHLARKLADDVFAAALPPISLLVFSLSQWENWLWGIQLNEFLSLLAFCGVIGFLAADRLPPKRVAAACVCAVVASFSFGNGLWAWPAALALLAAGRAPKSRVLAVAALGGAAVSLYFIGYHRPPHHPAPVLADRAGLVHFVLLFLGGAVCNFDRTGAALAGGAGLVALFWSCRSLIAGRLASWRELAPALALASYSLASAAASAVTRLGFGHVEGALASRYATFANPFWIALLLLLLLLARRLGAGLERGASLALAGLIGLCALASSAYGACGFVHLGRQLLIAHDELIRGQDHPVMPLVYPWPEDIDGCGPRLQELRLSVFRDGRQREQGRGFDPGTQVPGAVQGSYRVTVLPPTPAGLERYDLQGWAIDAARGAEPERIAILSGPKLLFSGPTFAIRRDLAWRYKNPQILFSGFNYVLPGRPPADLKVLAVAAYGGTSELSQARAENADPPRGGYASSP